MSKFVRNITLFLAGLPLLNAKAADGATAAQTALDSLNEPTAVSLRPLNLASDNLFAGHSSHSSHRSHSSHSSHYSGSSGSTYTPSPPPAPVPQPLYVAPSPPPAPRAPAPLKEPSQPSAPEHPASKTPLDKFGLSEPAGVGADSGTSSTERTKQSPAASELSSPAIAPSLSRSEMLRLQVMRVQIKLTTLGLYAGRIDGVLNAETKQGLGHFQLLKGIPESGLMTTPTLNALGVPAVN